MSEPPVPTGPEAVGLDIGGTKIAGFRVSADGRVAGGDSMAVDMTAPLRSHASDQGMTMATLPRTW